ncbi:MAG: PASTA domain-containing protein [Desulfobacterales bacterium]|nr:PASTA domain-containing protein [Desulfobacterales bacterium]
MIDKSRKWLKFRIFIVFVVFIMMTVAISARAYQLQILKNQRLSQLAERQYRRVISVVPKRGVIYDRNREEMAISIDVDSIYAEPIKISDAYKTAKELSPILKMSEKELAEKLAVKRPFTWVSRRVSPDQSIKVRNLKLSGVDFIKEGRRFYPNRETAGNIIGFAGLDSKGLEGLELQYNDYLKGETTYSIVERDALGRIMSHGLRQREEQTGNDLVLTIDKTIQYIAEKELKEAVDKAKAKSGVIVAMNPKTGEILAIATEPQFNPNIFWKYPSSSWRNRAVTDCFEPGSTFKVFLAAAALEKGIVSQKDTFFCENGSYNVAKRTIHDTHSYGWLSLQDIIKFSSNIGAGKIGEKLGKERLYEYVRKFGFGERTGIDLPGETPGQVRPPNEWSQIAVNTISFGHGVSVSAIQLISGLSAIANKGDLMKPYIVKQIVSPEGKIIKEFSPQVVRRVISEKTARDVTSIMKTTVLQGGTGTKASTDGYEVAGKTGTAQKPNPSSGGYFKDKYIALFMGFTPADDPNVAIVVLIDEPKGLFYGGDVAAPVFKKVAEETLHYMGILPTKIVAQDSPTPPKALSKPKGSDGLRKDADIKEEGTVKSEKFVMPDFTGMSIRQILRMIHDSKIDIRIIGSGRAVEQSLRPGSIVNDGEKCWVKFQQPS